MEKISWDHTHDNMGKALENTMSAINNSVEWIDCTVTGMGRVQVILKRSI